MRGTALGLLLALAAGCGGEKPKLVTVSGRVTANGRGVTAGSVYLTPDAANAYGKDRPSGALQLDGSFTVSTFPFGEGVPVGKYKVTLGPEVADRLKKPAYKDPAKTPWTLEVPDAGVSDLVLEVK